MLASVYFALGRFAYGLIGRHDWRFLIREISALLVFLALCIPILSIPAPFLSGVLIGAVYWGSAIIVLLLVNEKSKDMHVPAGIIDISWTGIMGGSLSAVIFAQGSAPFSDPPPAAGCKIEFYQALSENIRFLLGHTLGGFFALGAVLATCMAILWAGEVWRKSAPENGVAYKSTTISAAKMVFAFFWTSFGVFWWIVWPLCNKLLAVNLLMK